MVHRATQTQGHRIFNQDFTAQSNVQHPYKTNPMLHYQQHQNEPETVRIKKKSKHNQRGVTIISNTFIKKIRLNRETKPNIELNKQISHCKRMIKLKYSYIVIQSNLRNVTDTHISDNTYHSITT